MYSTPPSTVAAPGGGPNTTPHPPSNNLNIATVNVDGIKTKFNALKAFIASDQIKILSITETHTQNPIHVPNFSSYSSPSTFNNFYRGVALLIDSNINSIKHDLPPHLPDLEAVAADAQLNNKTITIISEGETIEHIISSCTVLAQSEYKKRHDIFAKIIHMNLAVKFNLLKDTQPHYIYKPESCLENDNYKLYFDRTVLTDIHIQHNRPDIIILNKQQKQAYLLDIAVPNSHNIRQTYNTKINKYLELSVAMRNLWCLEKISILPFIISATGIVPQSLFKNLKILDLENTLVVEIQKGILLYSCHIVSKFLNIDTEHKTQKSQNAEARRR
jgi:exonuclease III